ncbi:MAG: glycosyltransferase family 4 protein [Acidobacteriales bacterium]|nr:glycosyltransferase family 4 protein [Terriglobales bacterium]
MKIVISLPDLQQMLMVKRGAIADATYIIQNYIAQGLEANAHSIMFFGPFPPLPAVFTRDLEAPIAATRTWSGTAGFNATGAMFWRCQRALGVPYLNVFANLRLLDAALRCFPGCDLVYERNGLYRNGAARACKRLGIPYMLYCEADDIFEHDVMAKPIKGLLRRRARQTAEYNLTAADCVVCVSEQLRRHLTREWGVPADRVVVLPNAADTNVFKPDLDLRDRVRRALGIGDSPLIVFVGSFYVWHDIATLLGAFADVLRVHPDARLLLVGDGAQRATMMDQADTRGIAKAVMFKGMVAHTEVPGFLAAADVAVVPYPVLEQDVWLSPLKLFECMASGAAIVATGVGQIAEIITDGETGLLVPPGDSASMGRALIKLVADESLRSHCAQMARRRAVERHSWDQYCTRLEQIMLDVAARKFPRSMGADVN